MTPSSVPAKAERLLAEGLVEPLRDPARIFRVAGDHGTYIVAVSPSVRMCTCEHFRRGGAGDCSHITAAVERLLADYAREQGRPTRAGEYDTALAARHAREAEQADELFRRLA